MASIRGIQVGYPDVEEITATVPTTPTRRTFAPGETPAPSTRRTLRGDPLSRNPNYRAGATSPQAAEWEASRTVPTRMKSAVSLRTAAAPRLPGVMQTSYAGFLVDNAHDALENGINWQNGTALASPAVGAGAKALAAKAAPLASPVTNAISKAVPQFAKDAAGGLAAKAAPLLRAVNAAALPVTLGLTDANAYADPNELAKDNGPIPAKGATQDEMTARMNQMTPEQLADLRAGKPVSLPEAAAQKAQAAPAPTPAPAPAPQPTPAPAPAPQPKDFGAPAGTTVTTPIADQPSIRKIVGPDGKVTYSNADNYKDATNLANGNVSTVGIDKAAIERGIAADRDLHNARIEALDGRAPVEGGRVASLGGGGELPWWAGQFDFGRALMQQQQAQAQNAATLRGQDILRQNSLDDNSSRMAIAEMNAKATVASKAPTLKDQFETLKLAREQGYTQDKDGKWVHGGVDANGNQKIRTNEQVLADSKAAEELRLKEAEFNAGREKTWYERQQAMGATPQDIAAQQAVLQRTWNDFAARVDKTVQGGGVVNDPAIAQLLGVQPGTKVPLEAIQQRLMTANNGRASWANMPQDVENLLVPLAQQSVETQQNGVTQNRILRDALYGLGGAALGHFIRGRIPGGGLVAVPGVAAAGVVTSEVAGKMFDWDKFSPYSASSALQR